jgi:hypothetical protein
VGNLNTWRKFYFDAIKNPKVFKGWNIKVNPETEIIPVEERENYMQNRVYKTQTEKQDGITIERGYIVGTQMRQAKNRLQDEYNTFSA